MSNYSVKVKKSPGWRDRNTCVISISQGQENHEGQKLFSLLGWAVKNHETCVLQVSDTLYRYNLLDKGLSHDEAHRLAFQMGNEWMQRNAQTLDFFKPRFARIHRWNDWLYHDNFEQLHVGIKNLYANDGKFLAACRADIEMFMERKRRQNGGISEELLNRICTDYLLEELAAYIIISRTYSANRVYPAAPLDSFEYLRLHVAEIPAELRGMELAADVRITLRRRGESESIPAEDLKEAA